jgi:DNA-binding protein YbaB
MSGLGRNVTAGFGDFANIDVDKLMRDAQTRFARIKEMQTQAAELVGRAQDHDGRVHAQFTAGKGLSELFIDPRAMRMASQDLSATIVHVIQEAAADLQRQTGALMTETLGADAATLTDPEKAVAKAQEAQQAYDRTVGDVMGELERIQRRLNL